MDLIKKNVKDFVVANSHTNTWMIGKNSIKHHNQVKKIFTVS